MGSCFINQGRKDIIVGGTIKPIKKEFQFDQAWLTPQERNYVRKGSVVEVSTKGKSWLQGELIVAEQCRCELIQDVASTRLDRVFGNERIHAD